MCLRRSKTAILSAATSFRAVSLHFWNSDRNWLQPEPRAMKMRSPTLYEYTHTKKTFHRKRKDCEPTSWATKPGTKSIWPVLWNQKQWLMRGFPLDPLGFLLQVPRHLPTSAMSCIGGGGGGEVTDTPDCKCQGHWWRFLVVFSVSWQTTFLSPLPCWWWTNGNVRDSGPLLPSDIIWYKCIISTVKLRILLSTPLQAPVRQHRDKAIVTGGRAD